MAWEAPVLHDTKVGRTEKPLLRERETLKFEQVMP